MVSLHSLHEEPHSTPITRLPLWPTSIGDHFEIGTGQWPRPRVPKIVKGLTDRSLKPTFHLWLAKRSVSYQS